MLRLSRALCAVVCGPRDRPRNGTHWTRCDVGLNRQPICAQLDQSGAILGPALVGPRLANRSEDEVLILENADSQLSCLRMTCADTRRRSTSRTYHLWVYDNDVTQDFSRPVDAYEPIDADNLPS